LGGEGGGGGGRRTMRHVEPRTWHVPETSGPYDCNYMDRHEVTSILAYNSSSLYFSCRN